MCGRNQIVQQQELEFQNRPNSNLACVGPSRRQRSPAWNAPSPFPLFQAIERPFAVRKLIPDNKCRLACNLPQLRDFAPADVPLMFLGQRGPSTELSIEA